jgi:hypothetical protein
LGEKDDGEDQPKKEQDKKRTGHGGDCTCQGGAVARQRSQ